MWVRHAVYFRREGRNNSREDGVRYNEAPRSEHEGLLPTDCIQNERDEAITFVSSSITLGDDVETELTRNW